MLGYGAKSCEGCKDRFDCGLKAVMRSNIPASLMLFKSGEMINNIHKACPQCYSISNEVIGPFKYRLTFKFKNGEKLVKELDVGTLKVDT